MFVCFACDALCGVEYIMCDCVCSVYLRGVSMFPCVLFAMCCVMLHGLCMCVHVGVCVLLLCLRVVFVIYCVMLYGEFVCVFVCF